MRRTAALIPLGLCLTGCLAYCNGGPFLGKAARGDLDGIDESGELGRPLPPSCVDALPTMREAFDAVRPNLDSPDERTRIAAVEALRHLSTRAPEIYRNHYPGMFDRPLKDPSREVRWRAAWALMRLRETTPALRGASGDPDPLVASIAIEALGRAFDEEALIPIAAALDRTEPEVKEAALSALKTVTGKSFEDAASWKAYAEERARTRKKPVSPEDTAPERS